MSIGINPAPFKSCQLIHVLSLTIKIDVIDKDLPIFFKIAVQLRPFNYNTISIQPIDFSIFLLQLFPYSGAYKDIKPIQSLMSFSLLLFCIYCAHHNRNTPYPLANNMPFVN